MHVEFNKSKPDDKYLTRCYDYLYGVIMNDSNIFESINGRTKDKRVQFKESSAGMQKESGNR